MLQKSDLINEVTSQAVTLYLVCTVLRIDFFQMNHDTRFAVFGDRLSTIPDRGNRKRSSDFAEREERANGKREKVF